MIVQSLQALGSFFVRYRTSNYAPWGRNSVKQHRMNSVGDEIQTLKGVGL